MGALGVTMVLLLNIINVYYRGLDLKNDVTNAAVSSYTAVTEQGITSDSLNAVSSHFDAVAEKLWFLQNQRARFGGAEGVGVAADHLLQAGSAMTQAGTSFMAFVDTSRTLLDHLLEPETEGAVSLTEQWQAAYEKDFQPALVSLAEAEEQLAALDPSALPNEFQGSVSELKSQLSELNEVLNTFDETFPLILQLLGDQHPQRVLVLLENNHEARPGGGFIGSYVLVDLNEGYLSQMTFHDVYEIDGQYHETIEPPEEIARLTDEWRLRDSNYSPDMRVSAAKAAWFLEVEGGPGVDHVVTLDLTFVSELLGLIGPVKVAGLPVAVDASTFTTVLSALVESKWSGTQTPKAILGEVVDAAMAQLRTQKPWEELLQLFQTMARSKHVAAYSPHDSIQALFEEFGLSGGIPTPEPEDDYLMVMHTSIGGNKTDPTMEETIHHATQIDATGTVTNQLTLTRKHTWEDANELQLRNTLAQFGFSPVDAWLVDLLGRGANVAAMRVYVPHGSTLLSTQGIDLSEVEIHYDEELGLDYFYFTWTVYAGTESSMVFIYELPTSLVFEPLDEYRLTVFKQPGSAAGTFTKTLEGDIFLSVYRSFPEELTEATGENEVDQYQWTTALDQDLHLAQLWGE